jgi:hypothetical protein
MGLTTVVYGMVLTVLKQIAMEEGTKRPRRKPSQPIHGVDDAVPLPVSIILGPQHSFHDGISTSEAGGRQRVMLHFDH